MTYSMPLEVYLQSAVVRGILGTNQDRLSNYFILREGDEVFSLREATLEGPNQKTVAISSDEYLIYMQEVFLIADLSPQLRSERSGLEHLYVKKEASKALLGVGPFWLRGNIHLIPGSAMHDLLMAKTRFIPVTDATLVDRPDVGPRTYLVNRTKIGFITAVGEGLEELQLLGEILESHYPTEINHIKADGVIRITWDDGHVGEYAQEYLRGYCPCALCQGHGAQINFVSVPGAKLQEIRPVGNYAIEFRWHDGHSTGIYTYDYLRSLCPCSRCKESRSDSA